MWESEHMSCLMDYLFAKALFNQPWAARLRRQVNGGDNSDAFFWKGISEWVGQSRDIERPCSDCHGDSFIMRDDGRAVLDGDEAIGGISFLVGAFRSDRPRHDFPDACAHRPGQAVLR
jgi:hypothetical protein